MLHIKDNPGYQPMDDQLKVKTQDIVTQLYVTDTQQVKTHLEDFVYNMFKDSCPPSKTNQRFFPGAKTLKNCIDKVLAESL